MLQLSSIFSEVCMIQASTFVALNINVILTCRQKHFVVTFVIIGDGTGSFQIVNLKLFKLEKEKQLSLFL